MTWWSSTERPALSVSSLLLDRRHRWNSIWREAFADEVMYQSFIHTAFSLLNWQPSSLMDLNAGQYITKYTTKATRGRTTRISTFPSPPSGLLPAVVFDSYIIQMFKTLITSPQMVPQFKKKCLPLCPAVASRLSFWPHSPPRPLEVPLCRSVSVSSQTRTKQTSNVSVHICT